MQRVEKNDYQEWRSNVITERLFDFFKLEAELHRRRMASGEAIKDSFLETGENYTKILFAAQCYEMLDSIEYEDLFPEEINETSQES